MMAVSKPWIGDPDWEEKAFALHVKAMTTLREQLTSDSPDTAINFAMREVGANLFSSIGARSLAVESPIEALFYLALVPHRIRSGVEVWAQKPFGDYRVDFALRYPDPKSFDYSMVIVECDGHDFHERTKEQAEHDKQRDRWFTSQGLRVVRFTGREIWRDASACADEAVGLLVDSKGR